MKNSNSTMDFWSAIRDSRALHEDGMLPKPGETTEQPAQPVAPVAPQPAVTETVRRWSVNDGAPSYADAVEEWRRQGKPVLTELAKFFPAPTPEMTEEQARRKRAAGALGDSLKLLGEIYGNSQNATIRNRYGEPSGMAQANAEVDKATARYQQLLNAHNRVMGSAAMDEINRIYGSMGQQYSYEMQRRADAARSQAAQELARQKAQDALERDRRKAQQELEKLEKSHGYSMDLEKQRGKNRLAEIWEKGKQDRRTKQTAPAKAGGSGNMVNGKYLIRLENPSWDDPLAKRQGYLNKKTRDFYFTQAEYDRLKTEAAAALGSKIVHTSDHGDVLAPDDSLLPGLNEDQKAFRAIYLQNLPVKGKLDLDFYTKLYAQELYNRQSLGYDSGLKEQEAERERRAAEQRANYYQSK